MQVAELYCLLEIKLFCTAVYHLKYILSIGHGLNKWVFWVFSTLAETFCIFGDRDCTAVLLLHLIMEFCDYFFRMFNLFKSGTQMTSLLSQQWFWCGFPEKQLEKQLLKLHSVQCSC